MPWEVRRPPGYDYAENRGSHLPCRRRRGALYWPVTGCAGLRGRIRDQRQERRVVGAAAHVSLVSGWFPHAVIALAVASLAVGVWSARARWRRLGGVALAVTVAMVVLAVLIARLEVSDYTWPTSFYAWVGLVVFAAGVAAVGWRPSGWWSRIVALSSVVVTLLMAATLINQHYAYFPTPAAVFGQVAADAVPVSRVLPL